MERQVVVGRGVESTPVAQSLRAGAEEMPSEDAAELNEVGCRDSEWERAHHALVRLARRRTELDREEGTWLLAALRASVHSRFGFASFAEYVERQFGYAPRLTHEKLRVAGALENLPKMAEMLKAGQTSWSALRELTRVAQPQTEADWLAAARGRTVREVERLVAGHRPGSRPQDPIDRDALRHVLRFEVSGEVLAVFREALAKLRREAGEHLDDDAALLSMARQILGGPSDEGRASYQVALNLCEACQAATVIGDGEAVPVGPEVVELARCDGQHLGATHVGDVATRATQTIPPATRRFVLRRDQHRCVVPGCRHTLYVDVHHLRLRSEDGDHDPENLVTLCGAHHLALHRGRLTLLGTASALRVFHADGSKYGAPERPKEVDVRARALQALRRLGFGEGQVRRALDRTQPQQPLEATIRSALAHLTESALDPAG